LISLFKYPSGLSAKPGEQAVILTHELFKRAPISTFSGTIPWWIIWAKYLRPETSLTLAYEMVHIHHISVGSDYRRQGVGRALLGAARACGLELGIELLTLDVWSFNEDARAFFQRNGFNPYIERLWCR
jgi:GNAT superfamily N-acetyltransferase